MIKQFKKIQQKNNVITTRVKDEKQKKAPHKMLKI